MSTPPPVPPAYLPTLTEVIDLPFSGQDAWLSSPSEPRVPQAPPPSVSPMFSSDSAPSEVETPGDSALTLKVLSEVQRQVDGMLEYRLREAMSPLLARAAEGLVRDLRAELALTLRDVVTRAVAQEVARQRTRV